ncbi:hypothetical protein [Halomonas sp. E19]|uniref:hypothetical protein n=1 Tax=unclassified Halomonas TaxID=2609666 RepID=UPI0040344909
MTTLNFTSIWDLPLISRREPTEPAATAPAAERFLTIWDSPQRVESASRKRPARKLPKFYL